MVTGIYGPFLKDDEKEFIEEYKPWAFILFARNIGTRDDVKRLTASLREASGRENVFIFIDQEGGKVQRLHPPLAPHYPEARTMGVLYEKDQEKGLRASWIMSRLHAFDLTKLGINANCLPVLDVPMQGAHDIIGTRAYAFKPEIVTALGFAAASGLLDGGVLPVMKHIPGHGRAFSDTHVAPAHVNTPLNVLEQHDFVPFRNLADLPAAMTAHILYESIDSRVPATLSKRVIDHVIRETIGFDGVLISDDISMKALSEFNVSGDFAYLTHQVFTAGCDIILHCNGHLTEMRAIANAAPPLTGKALERVSKAHSRVKRPDTSDEILLREEFSELLMSI